MVPSASLFLVAGAVHYAEDDEDEACKAYGRSHLDAACAEYLGIEGLLGAAAAAHQYESCNDYGHAYGQQDVVLFVECKIVHYNLWISFLFVQVAFSHPQEARHADVGAEKRDDKCKAKDAGRHDDDVPLRNELCQFVVKAYHPEDKGYKYAVCDDCRYEAYAKAPQQEGPADETPPGTHQFHGVDDEAPAVDAEVHGVVDEADADDGQHGGDGQQDDGDGVEVAVQALHQFLLVDDVNDGFLLLEFVHYPFQAVAAHIGGLQSQFHGYAERVLVQKLAGVNAHGLHLLLQCLFAADVVDVVYVGLFRYLVLQFVSRGWGGSVGQHNGYRQVLMHIVAYLLGGEHKEDKRAQQ